MSNGKLLQLASQRKVFNQPASEEVAVIVGMETRIHATVEETFDGMSTVRFPGGTATASGDFKIGAPVILGIRPEEITVSHYRAEQDRSRIWIRGRVVGIFPWLAHYRVTIRAECGRVVALVGKSSLTELCLREGDDVLASVPLSAIHVIGR